MGTLTELDKHYLAQNFLGFFRRDYHRVAVAHIESGWAPPDTRVDEFESAIRAVCEPVFDRPLKDISFGRVLLRLFQTSRRFNIEVQPQLVLLQKTLLNIEGLGRQLDPGARPVGHGEAFLERWMSEQVGWRGFVRRMRDEAPTWTVVLPQLPRLVHQALAQQAAAQPVAMAARDARGAPAHEPAARRHRRAAHWIVRGRRAAAIRFRLRWLESDLVRHALSDRFDLHRALRGDESEKLDRLRRGGPSPAAAFHRGDRFRNVVRFGNVLGIPSVTSFPCRSGDRRTTVDRSKLVNAFKAAVVALLAANAVYFAVAGTASKALDAGAWLALLILFEVETAYGDRLRRGRRRLVVRAARLAAAAAVIAAAVGYLFEDNLLDAVNSAIWIAVVLLLEFEVRWPHIVARARTTFCRDGGYAVRGPRLAGDRMGSPGRVVRCAYDAALWLIAFATLELDVMNITRDRTPPETRA